ncbi:MAG: TIGR01212 family radical SAM protein [Spirochaetales bacterium]|nr:TIGR01212 family radical SAM protein [Spirochaetales bacterium]
MTRQTATPPFLSYADYLTQKYGCRVYRVSVDAGFSCPNRGENRTNPGCTFCHEQGSRAPYLDTATTIDEQINGAIRFLQHRYHAEKFILYFQAFSNTNKPAAELKRLYDQSLAFAPFVELVVSTRPDCIDREKTELLASYVTPAREVWVELGLQTIHNKTLSRINRGHSAEDFFAAYHLLKQAGIKVAVHCIFGLPGEGKKEIEATIDTIAALKPDGIKLHNLHIPKDTPLFEEYLQGEITVPSVHRYLDYTITTLTRIPKDTVILRLTTDTPQSERAAPLTFPVKAKFFILLREQMAKQKLFQGMYYKNNPE